MSTLIDFAESVGTFLISIFNTIVILVDRLVDTVLIMVDLVPRMLTTAMWLPAVCLGILGSVFAILIVEKILKLIGVFL